MAAYGSQLISYALEFSDGHRESVGRGSPQFTIVAVDPPALSRFLRKDPYSAALAFLRGDVSVRGDLVSAVRFYGQQAHSATSRWLVGALARLAHGRIASWFRARSASEIRHHYDRSNEFYRQFLDERMVYSCAYFHQADEPLAHAQEAKLEHICRKLNLQPGDQLLDIGCGWGALLVHAASRYGVTAVGCTLSLHQAEYARRAIADASLSRSVTVEERDYQAERGRFSKIASVGMFEHVGKHRLGAYFRKVYGLLAPGGLFLNHGIVRPEGTKPTADTLFLERRVFPGAVLVALSDVVREAGLAGFEVLDVENLRPHYALTCRAWLSRLQENEQRCRELVGAEAYRTWLLYLAASAANFEDGYSEIHQLLLSKRGQSGRRWLTRDFLYGG
jgi:cyclopropane-fatty-acyl-phospholipid synthase